MSMSQQDTDMGTTNSARRASLAGVHGQGEGGIPAPLLSFPCTPAGHALRAGLVLEEIMECVCRGGNPKRTLVNLALVNKAQLLNPVMDRVWGTMHSLAPFFLLLPHDNTAFNGSKKIIMTITPPASSPRSTMNESDISPHSETNASAISGSPGFPAFFKYAKRLRHLVFQGKTSADVIPLLSHIRLAYLQSPETPFFPALESVRFTSTEVGQHLAASVELLPFCPITRLEFTDLHMETATFVTVLSFFSLRFADSLHILRLRMPIAERPFSMQSLRYLTRLRGLHSLSITCQNSDFPVFELMPWVLGLSGLRDLELEAHVNGFLPQEYRELRTASRTLTLLRLGGGINFIRTVLGSFGGGHGTTGVQGTVTFAPCLPLDLTDRDLLITFVYDNFPAQPSVCFDLSSITISSP